MININMTISRQAGFAMPVSGIAPVAATRALPTVGGVSAVAAGWKRCEDMTPVRGYLRITDVAVLKDAFPGPSAWSPPI